jgi:lysozyme
VRRCWLIALVAGCGGVTPGEFDQANTMYCPMPVVEGLDVYGGDGTIDWTKVKASGREFAFMKATQGNYNKQSTFAANWTGSRAAGVLRSPYHFFDATIDGVQQAQWFLGEINSAGGFLPGDLPAMFDIECPTSSVQANTSTSCEGSSSGWAPPATVAQRAWDFIHTVETATGMKPILYSYAAWFADVGFTDPKLAAYPLFIASYGSCALVPAPWTSALFWQYTSTGTVPGVNKPGNTDVDRFFGSLGALGNYANPPDLGPAPADLALAPADDLGVSPDLDIDQPIMHGGCSCSF